MLVSFIILFLVPDSCRGMGNRRPMFEACAGAATAQALRGQATRVATLRAKVIVRVGESLMASTAANRVLERCSDCGAALVRP